VPRNRLSRRTALLAVLALLLAAPFERGRGCDVCPVDCPMHAARRASERPVGCHHGGVTPAAAPADDGACAMRASCGHHGTAIVAVFQAELPPALVVAAIEARPYAALPDRPVHAADGPAPPRRPPKSRVV